MGIVLDASVVIVLDRLRLISRLPNLGIDMFVPEAVLKELTSKQSKAIVKKGKAVAISPNSNRVPVEFRVGLGEGEMSVLSYCLENHRLWAILDDLAARKVAAKLGVKLGGTARLLRFMADRGVIQPALLPKLFDRLKQNHFWMSDSLIQTVIGEQPPDFSD
jgi:predicted nucleic acid-binding protein